MQSSMTIDLQPSGDSDSSDVDAEINDGFSPLDTFHRDVADEGKRLIVPHFFSIYHFLPKSFDFCNFFESGSLLRRAEMYQDYMKQLQIPTNRGSLIPFTSWVGLSISIKQLYGQPLHYLTNILLQHWDQSRFGSDSEDKTLDSIIHPSKAEATIWVLEEIHRLTSSHFHIARLWQSDPMYHSFIDPIVPKPLSPTSS